VWNIIDVIVIITTLVDIFYDITDLATKHHNSADDTVYKLRQTVDGLQLLRAIRLFRICEIFYPKLIRYLDTRVDSKMAFTYKLGKSYATGEAEILDMLPHMIDNKVIREEVKQKSVAWMSGDQPVIDFLFENVTVKKFQPGDVVFGEGQTILKICFHILLCNIF
jgi:hypothetical protein